MDLKFSRIGVGSVELAALECLVNITLSYNRRNVVSTLLRSF